MILWICRILRLLLSMLMSISMSMYYLLCKLHFVLLYDLFALSLSLVIFGSKSPIRKKLKEIPNISFSPRKMFQNRIWSYSPLMLSLAHHCWRSFWSRPSNCFHKLWQLSKSDLENTSTKTIFVPGQYVFFHNKDNDVSNIVVNNNKWIDCLFFGLKSGPFLPILSLSNRMALKLAQKHNKV